MKHSQITKDFLTEELKTKSIMQIAKETNCPRTTISRRIIQYDIELPTNTLIGRNFGKWRVEAEAGRRNGKIMWKVVCQCGRSNKVETGSLIGGNSTQCNSCKYPTKSEHYNWKGCGEISGTLWSRVGYESTRRSKKLPVEITLEYTWNLFLKQNRKCALSGLLIKFGSYATKDETTASLDRIDSNKGYIEGNVQWVHKTINKMKQDLTDEQFLEFCRHVYMHSQVNSDTDEEKTDGRDDN